MKPPATICFRCHNSFVHERVRCLADPRLFCRLLRTFAHVAELARAAYYDWDHHGKWHRYKRTVPILKCLN